MTSTVTLTIDNQLGKMGQPDELFTLTPHKDKAYLVAGQVVTEPSSVPNQTASKPNNGGIYQATSNPPRVRGIANYLLPDDQNQLVIFFTYGNCRLLIISKNLQLDDQLVQKAEDNGSNRVSGSFVQNNEVYTFQIIVNTTTSTDGKVTMCFLTATNTYTMYIQGLESESEALIGA
ncbi:hypothetical protein QCA50_011472 [Cerrena zonata]|uniref:Inclusion body protein n=1 Tax=Cerrena zonata TaxID=2478898 RepID=A0AAW0FWN9_9APHY